MGDKKGWNGAWAANPNLSHPSPLVPPPAASSINSQLLIGNAGEKSTGMLSPDGSGVVLLIGIAGDKSPGMLMDLEECH